MNEMGEEQFLKATLQSAAPAWMNFPDVERAEWVNDIIRAIWPHLDNMVEKILRNDVEPMAKEIFKEYNLWGFQFNKASCFCLLASCFVGVVVLVVVVADSAIAAAFVVATVATTTTAAASAVVVVAAADLIVALLLLLLLLLMLLLLLLPRT